MRAGGFNSSDTYLTEDFLADKVIPNMQQSSMNMTDDLEVLQYPPVRIEPSGYAYLGSQCELSALKTPTIDYSPYHSDLAFRPTISCAEACKLLTSYVRKKPDLMSLHLKLRNGYRASLVQGEGCSVDYHLLLTVLSERP